MELIRRDYALRIAAWQAAFGKKSGQGTEPSPAGLILDARKGPGCGDATTGPEAPAIRAASSRHGRTPGAPRSGRPADTVAGTAVAPVGGRHPFLNALNPCASSPCAALPNCGWPEIRCPRRAGIERQAAGCPAACATSSAWLVPLHR